MEHFAAVEVTASSQGGVGARSSLANPFVWRPISGKFYRTIEVKKERDTK
jgi:hypothetical protein